MRAAAEPASEWLGVAGGCTGCWVFTFLSAVGEATDDGDALDFGSEDMVETVDDLQTKLRATSRDE